MTQYFDSFELIYADSYDVDVCAMKKYVKRKIPVAYAKADEILPVGTPITIRTLEGDIDMTVEEDLYIIIGIKGEVYPNRQKKFLDTYAPLEETCDEKAYIQKREYAPVIKNRLNGRDMLLSDYAHGCIPRGETHIYARPLDKGVKVFTEWDKNKYMLGKPGDYLAVGCDDLHDIYVVERDIFVRSYDVEEK